MIWLAMHKNWKKQANKQIKNKLCSNNLKISWSIKLNFPNKFFNLKLVYKKNRKYTKFR